MNQLINDGGDCRTAPATPGLLIMVVLVQWKSIQNMWCLFLCELEMDDLALAKALLHSSLASSLGLSPFTVDLRLDQLPAYLSLYDSIG